MLLRFPFDWRNPIGYLVTTVYHYIALQRILGFFGLAVALLIGGFLYGIAIVYDMKTVLKSTNDNGIAGEPNKLQTLKKLNEFIGLHAMMKELSDISNSYFFKFLSELQAHAFLCVFTWEILTVLFCSNKKKLSKHQIVLTNGRSVSGPLSLN